MTAFLRDVRHSFRLIRRHPGHALAVLLTLAVAIGVGTVVIALIERIVLRLLPFRNSERVVRLQETHESVGKYWGASLPDMRDWAAASKSFEALAIARNYSMTLDTRSGSVGLSAGVATPQWLPILGIKPAMGRFFGEDEMREGNNHVVVLTNKTWRDHFGGDPKVLEQTIQLDGEPYRIVGILPANAWMYEFDWADVWLPLTAMPESVEKRKWRGFVALGRLAPGISIATAKHEIASIQQHLARTYPTTNDGVGIDMELLRNDVAGPVRKLLFMFLAGIGVVLLIACANVANLTLAFNSWRSREFSLRYAVGASAGRIATQILIESVVLALIGGFVGLGIAHAGLQLFRALAPDSIPRLDEVAIDARVALITMLLSVVSALLFGILPARRAARSGVPTGDRTTGPGTDLRRMLVVGELALAFVLVTAAGLMTRAFTRLLDWNPGFNSRGVVVSWAVAKQPGTADAVEKFERAAQAIRALPGVRAVGLTSAGPLFGGGDSDDVRIVGPNGIGTTKHAESWFDVSPDYFRTLGIPLLRGRELRDSDREGTEPVALINEAMARRYWGNSDPLGGRIQLGDQQCQVVGIVGNVRPFRPDQETPPEIYMPKRQNPRLATYFVIRSALPPPVLEQQVTAVIEKQEPGIRLGTFQSLQEKAKARRIAPRFNVAVVSILSVLAFALAAIGIYGVVSFSVASRARELAIRLAIGADPKRLIREIVTGAGKMFLVALIIGFAASIALGRVLAGFLFGLSPFDPLAWAAVSLSFACVVFVACWIPARRAALIDPAANLRIE